MKTDLETAREKVSDFKASIRLEIDNISISKQQLCQAEASMEISKRVIRSMLSHALGIERVELGSWGCEHSPTGRCFYDPAKDQCWDQCLMCGQVNDRGQG